MKNKHMKNKKKLILIGLIISLILFILYIFLGESLATSPTPGPTTEPTETIGWFESAIDGLVGVLLLPAKFFLIILGAIISLVMGLFAENGITGVLNNGGGITLQDILFNKVELLDINFFKQASSSSVATTIRNNVAIWYTSIRNVAAVLLAIIAVYVGIRMAISTLAEDRAKYKTMLVDWLTSLALLFLLHYIMVFTININNVFISLLENALDTNASSGATIDMSTEFLTKAVTEFSFTSGLAYAAVYLLLQVITFVFFLSYLWRMIRIAFLMIIAPLVTVTYSIDKMGDGKAQALNKWLKEFIYNVLIQPFHCITYLVLGTTAFNLLNQNNGATNNAGLANAIVAIAMMIFIYSAESIIKKIFHFESESMGDTVSNAAVGLTLFSKLGSSSSGRRSSSASSSSKNFAGSNTSNINNTKSTTTKMPRQVNNGTENDRTTQTANRNGTSGTSNNTGSTRQGETVSGNSVAGNNSGGKPKRNELI